MIKTLLTKYRIKPWLVITAIFMVLLTFLTYSQASASNITLSNNQQIAKQNITASALIDLTNQERVKNHLKPLATSEKLTKAAEAKAQDMKEKNYFDHYRPTDGKTPWAFLDEAGYHWQIAGENLARGFHTNGQVVDAWMESDTHRKNILNSRFEETGIATTTVYHNRRLMTLTVQMFGAEK